MELLICPQGSDGDVRGKGVGRGGFDGKWLDGGELGVGGFIFEFGDRLSTWPDWARGLIRASELRLAREVPETIRTLPRGGVNRDRTPLRGHRLTDASFADLWRITAGCPVSKERSGWLLPRHTPLSHRASGAKASSIPPRTREKDVARGTCLNIQGSSLSIAIQ